MSHRLLWALVGTILMSLGARADVVVRSDGHAFEAKVLSQNDKEIVIIPAYCDASATERMPRALVARVVAMDEHGALLSDNGVPA